MNVNLFNEQIMTDHEIKISIAKDMLWVLFNLKETLIFDSYIICLLNIEFPFINYSGLLNKYYYYINYYINEYIYYM